ncbi:DNA polymerase III subunit epsilon [Aliiroseovarius sediminis]|uniref:DNA polymerase III subunit epsilon n=1 Tax=Aliiroseovarius sediminis TaxID=2925839 RepID=UPI001F566047|nr:DNA polymerase III subunit epsilon [Aliiroseovarius sediminis]MCI2394665.1 DNA polymerase III subunit epsilon [Aliiroseovarius sediminis]
MREIVLDTETTGFDPESGDRIVEIGCLELYNHMPTGKTYHQYINPERDMPDEAFGVHGIGPDLLTVPRPPKPGEVTLRDKPVFKLVGQAFLDFIGDARLVIHNASFDMKFLNAELKWMGLPNIPWEQATDTLAIARTKFPGSPASLDALCRRFSIDNSSRTLHGALLDSEILAEVYLELIGGRQPDLVLAPDLDTSSSGGSSGAWRPYPRPNPLSGRITEKEAAAHDAFVEKLGCGALWKDLK